LQELHCTLPTLTWHVSPAVRVLDEGAEGAETFRSADRRDSINHPSQSTQSSVVGQSPEWACVAKYITSEYVMIQA
jgi:hypothetical protein